MSFGEPIVLLGLLAVPLLALVYLDHEKRRDAGAAAFASPALRAAVAPDSPGWRRHAPPAVLLVALAILVVALARPERTVAVEREQASIMLVTDYSGSMQATDVEPTRLVAARNAAGRFLDQVPEKVRVGLVAFNQDARLVQSPTIDREPLRRSLATLEPAGGTATGEAMRLAIRSLQRQASPASERIPAAIVLLSDGKSTTGRSPEEVAQTAKRERIPVYTVALGTPEGTIQAEVRGRTETRRVPPDPEAMRAVAEISGGEAFATADPEQLAAVYERLGSQLGEEDEQRQMTAAFAGGALLLIVGAVGLSLHLFRRVT